MATNSMSGLIDDYKNLRSIPAMLSVVFVVASLYQFGGISEITLNWISYTLTAEHAAIISIAVYAAAFASSETKRFEHYEDWEKLMIAAGPVLILGHQYITWVSDQFAAHSPTLSIIGFVVAAASWGVAVR